MRISLSMEIVKKFYVADVGRSGIVPDSSLVQRANNILDEIPTRFDFNIGLATTTAFQTQYTLQPRNTILVKSGETDLRRTLIHELAHHCWHFLATETHKAYVTKRCKRRGLDPNEQFASCCEFFVLGSCLRFDERDPTTSRKLAPKFKEIVANYFVL